MSRNTFHLPFALTPPRLGCYGGAPIWAWSRLAETKRGRLACNALCSSRLVSIRIVFQEHLEARFASKAGAAVPGASRMVRFLLCRFCILLQSASRQGVRQWRMPLVPRCPVLPAGWFSLSLLCRFCFPAPKRFEAR